MGPIAQQAAGRCGDGWLCSGLTAHLVVLWGVHGELEQAMEQALHLTDMTAHTTPAHHVRHYPLGTLPQGAPPSGSRPQ